MTSRADQPPIFVVSLPDAVARRKSSAQYLGALNLAFEFFDAVDGRGGMPALERGERLLPDYCSQHYPYRRSRPLSALEVACYLSHFRLNKALLGSRHSARSGVGRRYGEY